MNAMTTSTISATIFGAIDDHSQPALTFYDDDSGERTELSWATLGNWAAKTANFLVDDQGCLPGDEVLVDLPEHWQTAGILLGCWWAGAHIRLAGDEPDSPAVVFTDRTGIDRHPDADEVVVAPLDPFALGVPGLPAGVADYGSQVRIHGDHFSGPPYAGAALDGVAGPEVLGQARSAAAREAIVAGARVLSTREWRSSTGVVENFLAPLVVGAGLVWVAHPSGDQAARALTEHAGIVLT